jgi:iron-sulfur cluster insertion protein
MVSMSIQLTEAALQKIKYFAAQEASEKPYFRIYVQGGGCSGFEYGFSFDQKNETDQLTDIEGLQVLIDPFSATYIQDATIDYYEDFRGAGFRVQNPNAKSTCGCGMSFAV